MGHRQVHGWPLKDLILHLSAGLSAFGVILVASGDNVIAATAGGIIGALWFALGCAYGYGEAVRL